MRLAFLVCTGMLFAVPALAQNTGNVGQPSKTVPQAGQTTGSPLDNPSAPGAGAPTARDPAGVPAGNSNNPLPRDLSATSGGLVR